MSLTPVMPGEVARIEVVMYADAAVSIGGNIGDVNLAIGMLEAALEAVKTQLRSPTGGLIVPAAEVVEHPEFPLTEAR